MFYFKFYFESTDNQLLGIRSIPSHVFQVKFQKFCFFKLAASKLARLRVYQSGG